MSRDTRDKPDRQGSNSRKVDWIVLSVSILGVVIVAAASIQAGEAGLIASLGSYVITSASF